MQLTHDSLLVYDGHFGAHGICHVRVYEGGCRPVVVVGELDDNPWTSVTNAVCMVAQAIDEDVFVDGREFELVEHHPDSLGDPGTPSFKAVHFEQEDRREAARDRLVGVGPDVERVAAVDCAPTNFREPRWSPIEDIDAFLGCRVRVWPAGAYTALAVAGVRGERMRRAVAARAWATSRQLEALLSDSPR